MLLDLGPDDTVIVPSFTFTTSALAFARQGARILFCDIEPRHPRHRPRSTSPSCSTTPCGRSCSSTTPASRCDVAGVRKVLEPTGPTSPSSRTPRTRCSAAGRGEPLGSLGRMASLSFHETKNFVCGEGGALLLNDPRDVDRARVLYEKGTDRRAFLLGQVDKYSWRDTGSSFGMSDALAAYLHRPARAGRDDPGQAAPACSRRYLEAAGGARGRAGAAAAGACRPTASPPGTSSTCSCPTTTSGTRVMAQLRERGHRRRRSTTCRCTAPTAAAGSPRGRGGVPGLHRRERPADPAAVPQQPHRGRRHPRRRDPGRGQGGEVTRRRSARGPPRSRSPTTGGTPPGRPCSRPRWASQLGSPDRLLDVGSADGPSVAWMRGDGQHVTVDLDPRGLAPGDGVQRLRARRCRSVTPASTWWRASTWSSTANPSRSALAELARVLRPGGWLLLSVPAYQWAWTDHDVRAGPPSALHPAAAARRGRGGRVRRTSVQLRVRGGLPALRGRAAGPAAADRRPGADDGLPQVSPTASGCSRDLAGREHGSCGGATCRSAHRSSWPAEAV